MDITGNVTVRKVHRETGEVLYERKEANAVTAKGKEMVLNKIAGTGTYSGDTLTGNNARVRVYSDAGTTLETTLQVGSNLTPGNNGTGGYTYTVEDDTADTYTAAYLRLYTTDWTAPTTDAASFAYNDITNLVKETYERLEISWTITIGDAGGTEVLDLTQSFRNRARDLLNGASTADFNPAYLLVWGSTGSPDFNRLADDTVVNTDSYQGTSPWYTKASTSVTMDGTTGINFYFVIPDGEAEASGGDDWINMTINNLSPPNASSISIHNPSFVDAEIHTGVTNGVNGTEGLPSSGSKPADAEWQYTFNLNVS